MNKHYFAVVFLLFASFTVTAQNGVGINNPTPAATAALDVTSSTQGILIPRMTSTLRGQIGSPGAPATGLLVYQTDAPVGFYFYNGTSWVSLSNGAAGGDLTGTYPNPTINTTATTGANLVTAINNSASSINAARLQSTVTTQGNTFNAANLLVKLDGSNKLPAVDGSQLTNLASNPAGMLCNNSVNPSGQTTFYMHPTAYNDGIQYLGNAEIVMPFNCTLDNFFVSIVVNNNTVQPSGTTVDLVVLKNGNPTSLAIPTLTSPVALNTYVTGSDLVHSVSCVAGDRITIRCIVGSATPAFRLATAIKYH